MWVCKIPPLSPFPRTPPAAYAIEATTCAYPLSIQMRDACPASRRNGREFSRSPKRFIGFRHADEFAPAGCRSSQPRGAMHSISIRPISFYVLDWHWNNFTV